MCYLLLKSRKQSDTCQEKSSGKGSARVFNLILGSGQVTQWVNITVMNVVNYIA